MRSSPVCFRLFGLLNFSKWFNVKSNIHYRVFHTADSIVLVKDGNELWRVGCQDIDEVGFCTCDPDPVLWDYFFLMNANGRTYYLAVDPEWEGVDDIIEFLSGKMGTDLGRYSIANSIKRSSIVAWPEERVGNDFNFLSEPEF